MIFSRSKSFRKETVLQTGNNAGLGKMYYAMRKRF